MQFKRRHFLALLSSCACLPPNYLAAETVTTDDFFPHVPPSLQWPRKRLVVALWQYFPISFDNKPAKFDYYTKQLMPPGGENGKHLKYGGFVRDRPIPQQPILTKDWRIELAKRDIEAARAAGIDAFIFNVSSIDPKQGYLNNLSNILAAIEDGDSNFRVTPCIDAVTIANDVPVDDIVNAIVPALKRPGALRSSNGKIILSSFAAENWSVERWQMIFNGLEKAGIETVFRPLFLIPGRVTNGHLAMADLVGWWAGNHIAGIPDLAAKAKEAAAAGKGYIWSVWPQDSRPKSGWYAEARNSQLFRESWQAALESDAEWICVLTWNDYAETSHIRPSVGVQYAFADLNRFYSDWFRSGKQPDIRRDVIYYFHRRDYADESKGIDPSHAALKMKFGQSPCNDLEVVCFVREHGTLSIESGTTLAQFEVTSGITALRVALQPGMQKATFRPTGAGKAISVSSPFWVRPHWDWEDLTYRGGGSSRGNVAGTIEFAN